MANGDEFFYENQFPDNLNRNYVLFFFLCIENVFLSNFSDF